MIGMPACAQHRAAVRFLRGGDGGGGRAGGLAHGVELLARGDGRHANRGHKERGPLLDDDVQQLEERAACVVLVGLAGRTANLRQEQVHAPGRGLVLEPLLDLLALLTQHLRRVAKPADDAEPALVRDGRRQLRPRGDVHAGEEDRLAQAEELLRGARIGLSAWPAAGVAPAAGHSEDGAAPLEEMESSAEVDLPGGRVRTVIGVLMVSLDMLFEGFRRV